MLTISSATRILNESAIAAPAVADTSCSEADALPIFSSLNTRARRSTRSTCSVCRTGSTSSSPAAAPPSVPLRLALRALTAAPPLLALLRTPMTIVSRKKGAIANRSIQLKALPMKARLLGEVAKRSSSSRVKQVTANKPACAVPQ